MKVIHTFVYYIYNMLHYYIKDIIGDDPLKSKVMKLVYIGKMTFNINGMIFHFTLNNSFK
jgi:hypothetical protein